MHTRTTVVDGVTADVPPLSPGTNPPPLATVRAVPNPLSASTRIVYTLTHPADGVDPDLLRRRPVRANVRAGGTSRSARTSIPFDGKDDDGHRLAAGAYFIRLETDKVKVAGKLFVVNGN